MNSVSHLRSVFTLSAPGDFHDQQRLSDLISAVYDAAIEASRWESAIERVAGFVGGSGAGLFCKDVGVPHASIPHRVGFQTPLPVALFQQIYPAAEGHFLGDLEQPIATTDLMSVDELAKSELYRQWAEPQGLVDFLSAVVDRTTISAAIFGTSDASVNRKPSTIRPGRPNLDMAARRPARVEAAGSRARDPPASRSHSEFPGDRTCRPSGGSRNRCMTG
jgi:hypothetical protein